MQRGRGAIVADIGGDRPGGGARIQDLGFRDLMDESALGQNAEEIGFVGAHGRAATLLVVTLSSFWRGWCNRSGAGFNHEA